MAMNQVSPVNVKSTSMENPAYVVEQAAPLGDSAQETVKAQSTKDVVQEYFKDTPIMAKVAKCESEFRQVDKSGKTLRGRVNSADVGVMQINEKYHLERSQKLGLDIHTLAGNLAYAEVLYNEQGTKPWMASSPCWSKI